MNAETSTIADAWSVYEADLPRDTSLRQRVLLKRAFFMGSLFAAAAVKATPERRDALIAEAVAFGRMIGTPAESADIGGSR